MFFSDSFTVNELGHLAIDNCDALMLAERYGTPLYVMSEAEIERNITRYKESLSRYYGGNGGVAYASKAFCCKEIYRLMNRFGASVDVVSGGELHTALAAGFPPERIYFHGNNKTPPEIARAVDVGVGRIVADNLPELEILAATAEAAGRVVPVMLRVKPGVDPHTHEFIRTGQIDSKFGFGLDTGEAMSAAKFAAQSGSLEVKGVHCHIGSQIFQTDPFVHSAQVMVEFMAAARDTLGISMSELNLGGGFGIRYLPGHCPAPYDSYMRAVAESVKDTCRRVGLSLPFITLEPGRSIVGPAGVTLYRAGAIKVIPGVRTYLTIDGGMTDNPRYALYKSEYSVLVASKAGQPKSDVVTIAGRCCESGDIIGEGMPIQPPSEGDVIAVTETGAYNYTMASNYNRLPRPAIVMTNKGEHRLIVRRESYDDLISNDI